MKLLTSMPFFFSLEKLKHLALPHTSVPLTSNYLIHVISLSIFFHMIMSIDHSKENEFHVSAALTTTSPTRAPTMTQASPSTPSNDLSSARIISDRDCFKQGRDKDCVWNPNLLQDDSFDNICEPSQSWLLYSDRCPSFEGDSCSFSSPDYCLWGSKSSEKTICFHPPLMRFHTLMNDFLDNDRAMSDLVINLPELCSRVLYNYTCVEQPYCEWKPNENTPSELLKLRSEHDDTSEVQSIIVVGSFDPSSQPLPDIQSVSVKAPSYNKKIITITSQPNKDQPSELVMFRLRVGQHRSSWIPLIASSKQLENSLNSILDDLYEPNYANVFMSDCDSDVLFGRCMWKIKLTNELDSSHSISLDAVSFNGTTLDASDSTSNLVIITGHERHTETIVLAGPKPVYNGTFILRYTPQVCSSGDLKSCAYDSAQIPIGSNDTEISRILLQTMAAKNIRAFDYVSVKSIPPSNVQPISGLNETTTRILYAWNISFTGQVQIMENAEFSLTPLWRFNGCDRCVNFCYEKENVTIVDNDTVIIPPKNTSYALPGDIYLGSSLLVQSPKVIGSFRLKSCKFSTLLPGFIFAEQGGDVIISSENITSYIQEGSFIRLAGRAYTLSKILSNRDNNFSDGRITMLLDKPFMGLTPENATISQDPFGIRGYVCQYTVSETIPHNMAATPNTADQGQASFQDRINLITESLSTITRSTASALNEFTWNITFSQLLGKDIPILKVADEVNYMNFPPGIKVQITKVQQGIVPPLGTYRIAFAGYDGDADDYLRINTDNIAKKFSDCDGRVAECSVLTRTPPPARKIFFTRAIPIGATAGDLQAALSVLGNLAPSSISVRRDEFTFADPFTSQVNQTLFYGYKYTINYLGDNPNLPTGVDANIPSLFVVDDSKLYGNDAQVVVITEREGQGNLYKPTVDVYVEVAKYTTRSPCVVNSTYRYTMIDLLNGDSESLKALDSKIYSCALSNEYDSTGVQRFRKRSECVGQIEYQTVVSPCVWRGKDSPVYNKGTDKDLSDDKEFRSKLDNLWWSDALYSGGEGITRNANCTVSLLYLSQQLLKVYWNGGKRNVSYDSSVLYNNADAYFHKLSTCAQNPVFWLNSTTPIYVDIFQNIMLLTIYTFGAAYALAGLVLAYRMGKFKLSFNPDRKGVKTMCTGFAIIFLAFVFGCIIGFIVGAVPALLISSIYNSIPNELQAPMAISLGIAQALLFLYFDLGRGSRQTEKKIREE